MVSPRNLLSLIESTLLGPTIPTPSQRIELLHSIRQSLPSLRSLLSYPPPKPTDRVQVQSKEVRLPDSGPISLDDQDVQIALKLSDDLHLNEVDSVRLLVSANQEWGLLGREPLEIFRLAAGLWYTERRDLITALYTLLRAVVLDQGLEPDLVADIQRFLGDLINAGVRKRLISLIKELNLEEPSGLGGPNCEHYILDSRGALVERRAVVSRERLILAHCLVLSVLVVRANLLHTFSTVPRELNFIEHTSDIGWKEYHRARPVIIDSGLYSLNKSDLFWIPQKRSMPTAFKLFTGSAWMMLSRPFVEYLLWGWDNLPRIVLMYYANFLSTPEGYFHTVICNAEEFRNTTVNHDLHFISWDNPPKQHPHVLTLNDYHNMVDSNASFARKIHRNEPVLDKIDSELLGRKVDGFVPGSWFDGGDANATISQYFLQNITSLRPGPGARRIKSLVSGLLSDKDFDKNHCL